MWGKCFNPKPNGISAASGQEAYISGQHWCYHCIPKEGIANLLMQLTHTHLSYLFGRFVGGQPQWMLAPRLFSWCPSCACSTQHARMPLVQGLPPRLLVQLIDRPLEPHAATSPRTAAGTAFNHLGLQRGLGYWLPCCVLHTTYPSRRSHQSRIAPCKTV